MFAGSLFPRAPGAHFMLVSSWAVALHRSIHFNFTVVYYQSCNNDREVPVKPQAMPAFYLGPRVRSVIGNCSSNLKLMMRTQCSSKRHSCEITHVTEEVSTYSSVSAQSLEEREREEGK